MDDGLVPIGSGFKGCFGCGDDNSTGLRLQFSKTIDEDKVVAKTTIEQNHAGYSRFAHGGIVATLLDEAMGWALLHLVGRWGVTRDLQIAYRRPVYIGRPLVLSGTSVSVEGELALLESRLEDERGRLLASAKGTWTLIRERHADGDKP